MFNLMQPRQFCLGAKLTISRSSFQKEFFLLNTIRTVYFNDAIYNQNQYLVNPTQEVYYVQLKHLANITSFWK